MTLCIRVPGSKSMTQRALIISALADGPMTIRGALDCDDSRHLTQILRSLGVGVDREGDRVRVTPGALRARGEVLFCGNAGTAMRFGCCLSLVCQGELALDGDGRMRERPVGALGRTLGQMGVDVRYLLKEDHPPIKLKRTSTPPAAAQVDGSISSQFASGLLMVAPRLPAGLSLTLRGPIVSRPYINMTTRMMQQAGAELSWIDDAVVRVAPRPYGCASVGPEGLFIEPDWSAAAFLLAAAAIAGCEIHIPDLPGVERSLQGDVAFVLWMNELKRDREHDFDLSHTPDLIAPLAAACLFADRPSHIRGAAHTRVKESDRIAVLSSELGKLGADIRQLPEGLDIVPLREVPTAEIQLDPADDHRMAMAFGVVSLRVPGIRVQRPGCVSKSFPGFWEALAKIRNRARVRTGGGR